MSPSTFPIWAQRLIAIVVACLLMERILSFIEREPGGWAYTARVSLPFGLAAVGIVTLRSAYREMRELEASYKQRKAEEVTKRIQILADLLARGGPEAADAAALTHCMIRLAEVGTADAGAAQSAADHGLEATGDVDSEAAPSSSTDEDQSVPTVQSESTASRSDDADRG